jgi:excisionase family DNA binding protein
MAIFEQKQQPSSKELAMKPQLLNTQGVAAPVYLNVKQVAELLQVKPRTVYSWVYKRVIPYERKGGSLRFRLDIIEHWDVQRAA